MEKIFYLAQIFGALRSIGTILLVISAIALLILFTAFCDNTNCQDNEEYRNFCKMAFISLIIGFLAVCFVPSKETYLLMVGGRVVDSAIEQNPSVKELPGNTLQLLNEYIISKTEDVRSKGGEE
jgi:hypothetical protein